jgi:hypothetical protein
MDHLPQVNTPLEGPDRRRDARQTLVARAMLFVEEGVGAPLRVELRNISVSGCSFQAREAPLHANRYRIKIEIGPMSYASPVRIISTRQTGYGQFEIGAEFLRSTLQLRPDTDGTTYRQAG